MIKKMIEDDYPKHPGCLVLAALLAYILAVTIGFVVVAVVVNLVL